MTTTIPTPYSMAAPLRADRETGAVRIGDSRVTLDTVVGCFKRGDSPAAIAESFDALSLADVYAVIAYYLQRADEVDAYLESREEDSEQGWAIIEADPKNQALRERMTARRAAAS